MQIVHYPHPALRWKSKEVTRIDKGLKSIVAEMFELMYEARGVGLAANQVALPYRLFVMNPTADANEKDAEHVFLNPQIIKRNGSEVAEEGCLSLPGINGDVPRAATIVVDAFDLSGENYRYELDGLPARIVQHETDHLDGVLFFDRMPEDKAAELKLQLDDLESQFLAAQSGGDIGSIAELETQLRELETERTG